jgi:hypothetical protein
METLRRAIAVGAAIAYREEARTSMRAACKAVADSCSNDAFRLTTDQIRSWSRRAEGGLFDVAISGSANDIVTQARGMSSRDDLPTRILKVTRSLIWQLSTPNVGHIPR